MASGQAWRVPAYWPGGARHGGDVSPVCGFNVEYGKACCKTGGGRGLADVERERDEQQKL
jgi:hypothetical protein